MKDGRTSLPEVRFQLIHITRAWHAEEAQAKCLRTRRAWAVIHRVSPSDFYPPGSGIGNEARASFNKTGISNGLGSLQATCQRVICEKVGIHRTKTLP